MQKKNYHPNSSIMGKGYTCQDCGANYSYMFNYCPDCGRKHVHMKWPSYPMGLPLSPKAKKASDEFFDVCKVRD